MRNKVWLTACIAGMFSIAFMLTTCGGQLYIPAPKEDVPDNGSSANGDYDDITVGGDVDIDSGDANMGSDSDADQGDTNGTNGDTAQNGDGSGTDPGDTDTGSGGDSGSGDNDTDPTGYPEEFACGDGKYFICHIPLGNPDGAHVLCVNEEAVAALLEHGDVLGPCDIASNGDDGSDATDDDGATSDGGTDPAGPYACGGGEKALICHLPNGDPERAKTLCVGEPAAGAHQDHGDLLGSCED